MSVRVVGHCLHEKVCKIPVCHNSQKCEHFSMKAAKPQMFSEECGYSMVNDRNALEWLVLWCLSQDDPCISIGRGKELLGFIDMQQMRDFMNKNVGVEDKYIEGSIWK